MRYAVTVLLVLLIIGGLAALKGAQFAALADSGEQAQKDGPPPEAVATARAKTAAWGESLATVGTVASSKGVTVTTEVPGAITRIAFDSGQSVKAGQVLIELDARIERAELASASAERDLASLNAQRSRALASRGALAPAALDQDQAQLAAANANSAAIRAQLSKKVIRAPFAGRLGIRAVSLGQYLTPGTPITTLESVDDAFVDFTLPQNQLGEVGAGSKVKIQLEPSEAAVALGEQTRREQGNGEQGKREHGKRERDEGAVIEGTVTAVSPSISESTRSLELRASVPNGDERLRPGMFVDVSVLLPEQREHVIVPATAIMHATYGDSLFVVEDKKKNAPGMRKTPDGKPVRVARQQFVRLGARRGDYVAVLAGLKANQEVVTEGGFKLRNGAPIVVTQDAAPRAQLDPRPENR